MSSRRPLKGVALLREDIYTVSHTLLYICWRFLDTFFDCLLCPPTLLLNRHLLPFIRKFDSSLCFFCRVFFFVVTYATHFTHRMRLPVSPPSLRHKRRRSLLPSRRFEERRARKLQSHYRNLLAFAHFSLPLSSIRYRMSLCSH